MHGRIAMRRSRSAAWSRTLGALAVPVLALDALGAKVGFVPREAIVPALLLSFALAITASFLAAYALSDIWRNGTLGAGAAAAALVYSLPVLAILAGVAALALIYPRLNDVSTDLNDPPAFENAVIPESDATDDDRGEMQTKAYPDLAPRLYDATIENVYTAARGLVDERGWTVTRDVPPPSLAKETAPQSGAGGNAPAADAALNAKSVMTQSRSEAVGSGQTDDQNAPSPEQNAPDPSSGTAILQAIARTPILGFLDDVVLRIQSGPDGITVDMRSASETGLHDLGQNARRIRRFLADLDLALQPPPDTNHPGASAGSSQSP